MDYIESQTDYCRRLLSTLRIEELRYITFSGTDGKFSSSADIHLSATKSEFIEFIIDALEAKTIDLSYAAMKMCRRPHIWFTMLTGNITQLPNQANLQQFFSTNDEGWFIGTDFRNRHRVLMI